MNEERQGMVDLLNVMKDLNGQGFRLNNEINALIKVMLHSFNITSAMIEHQNKPKSNVVEKFKKSVDVKSTVNGKLVIVDESDRGVGKTTSLINMANQLNVPIIVKNTSQAKLIQSTCLERKIKTPFLHNVTGLRGLIFPNGVLLEEGLSVQEILDIRKDIIIRGGYCNLNFITK